MKPLSLKFLVKLLLLPQCRFVKLQNKLDCRVNHSEKFWSFTNITPTIYKLFKNQEVMTKPDVEFSEFMIKKIIVQL